MQRTIHSAFTEKECGLAATATSQLAEFCLEPEWAGSTMITSQLTTAQWHASIGDSTLVYATLDRLMHNAYRWALNGELMRN